MSKTTGKIHGNGIELPQTPMLSECSPGLFPLSNAVYTRIPPPSDVVFELIRGEGCGKTTLEVFKMGRRDDGK